MGSEELSKGQVTVLDESCWRLPEDSTSRAGPQRQQTTICAKGEQIACSHVREKSPQLPDGAQSTPEALEHRNVGLQFLESLVLAGVIICSGIASRFRTTPVKHPAPLSVKLPALRRP